jgi:hypothetical protein
MIKKTISISIMFIVLLVAVGACAQDFREETKIRYLIASVAALEGAKFIRNGSEYDAHSAADHLRLKLRNAGARVKTAEDFIKFCGSKSFRSGKPYLIRFADGTTMNSESFLRKKLLELTKDRP